MGESFFLWDWANWLDKQVDKGEGFFEWVKESPDSNIAFVVTWGGYMAGDVSRGTVDVLRLGKGVTEKGGFEGFVDDGFRLLGFIPAVKQGKKIPEAASAIKKLCRKGNLKANRVAVRQGQGPCVIISTAQAITHSGQRFVKPLELKKMLGGMSKKDLDRHFENIKEGAEDVHGLSLGTWGETLDDMLAKRGYGDDFYEIADDVIRVPPASRKGFLKVWLERRRRLWASDSTGHLDFGLRRLGFKARRKPLGENPLHDLRDIVKDEQSPFVVIGLLGRTADYVAKEKKILDKLRQLERLGDKMKHNIRHPNPKWAKLARRDGRIQKAVKDYADAQSEWFETISEGHAVYAYFDKKTGMRKLFDATRGEVHDLTEDGLLAIARANGFAKAEIVGNALLIDRARRGAWSLRRPGRYGLARDVVLFTGSQIAYQQVKNNWYFEGYGLLPSWDSSAGTGVIDPRFGSIFHPGNRTQRTLWLHDPQMGDGVRGLLQQPRIRFVLHQTPDYFGRFDLGSARRIESIDMLGDLPIGKTVGK